MQMDEKEILFRWSRSDQNKEMVKILAELNCCSTQEIAEILQRNGIKVTTRRKKKMQTKKIPKSVQEILIKELDNINDNINTDIEDYQQQISALDEQIADINDQIGDLNARYEEIDNFLSGMGVKVAPVQQEDADGETT